MSVISYNEIGNCITVIRATSGGTVFSGNLAGAGHDLFTDTAIVNDAVYFAGPVLDTRSIANVLLTINTPLLATSITVVWEYYHRAVASWVEVPLLVDGSNAFQASGSVVVEFPVPPYNDYNQFVGGIRGAFVRCRITAVSGLTEGGSISSTAQGGNGVVSTSGYTESSPLTSTILYNWIIANTPIPARKEASTFHFPCFITNASNSRWLSKDEVLFFGNGSGLAGTVLGEFVGGSETVSGVNASRGTAIFHCMRTGGSGINLSFAKMYGCFVKSFDFYDENQNSSSYSGNSSLSNSGTNTVLDKTVVFNNGYFTSATGSLKRAVIIGQVICTAKFEDSGEKFTNALFYNQGNLFIMYAASETYRDIVWEVSNYVFIKIANGANVTATLIDPTPALPDATTTAFPRTIANSGWVRGYDFQVHEKFTLRATVIDVDGNRLQGVEMTASEDSGVLSDIVLTSDALGESGEFLFLTRRFFYQAGSGLENTASADTFNWTVTFKKNGFQTKSVKLTMNQKRNEIVVLVKTVNAILGRGQLLINANPTDSQSDVFI